MRMLFYAGLNGGSTFSRLQEHHEITVDDQQQEEYGTPTEIPSFTENNPEPFESGLKDTKYNATHQRNPSIYPPKKKY